MNKRTLKALRGSIAKWEKIVSGDAEDMGAENCPLCKLFVEDFCDGCPVRKESGVPGCIQTPWHRWAKAQNQRFHWTANTKRRKKLAQAELDYLKSLLPQPTGQRP